MVNTGGSIITLTPQSVISQAMKKCGAFEQGQTPTASDISDGYIELLGLYAEWGASRWTQFQLGDSSINSTGAVTYSIGPGGNFNVPERPDHIYSSFVRLLNVSPPNQSDYPLEIIKAREQYNLICNKQIASLPYWLYYEPGWPLGTLYFWPVPLNAQYELHIATLNTLLGAVVNLATPITLPSVYFPATIYNLAIRLCETYQIEPRPMTIRLANSTLQALKKANNQMPNLKMPAHLIRPGIYNPYSDQVR